MTVLISKGTYAGGFFGTRQDEQIDLYAFRQHLKVYIIQRPDQGSAMYTVQVVSTTQRPLKAASLKWLLVWEQWLEHTFQGQGSRGGTSGYQGPALRSPGGPVFSVTSSNEAPYLG